jgi:hypothetical protein
VHLNLEEVRHRLRMNQEHLALYVLAQGCPMSKCRGYLISPFRATRIND